MGKVNGKGIGDHTVEDFEYKTGFFLHLIGHRQPIRVLNWENSPNSFYFYWSEMERRWASLVAQW